MRIYDVSLTLSPDLPIWPGDTPYERVRADSLAAGGANTSRIQMSVHMGTHVDAPEHFLGNGKTVEQMPLSTLIGRVYVAYLPSAELITAAALEQAEIPPRTRRILFKTRNSEYWKNQDRAFHTDFVALSANGAEFLAERGLKLVGIDYLSIAPYHAGQATHEILLKKGVIILEGLDLSQVAPGRYTLYCLPLKLAGSDGAPTRVVLVGV
jgi:arylformamidase